MGQMHVKNQSAAVRVDHVVARDNVILGINSVKQLINRSPELVLEIYICIENKRIESILHVARENDISIQKVSAKSLDKYGSKHQGIVARIKANKILRESDLKGFISEIQIPLFLILDGIQDPHNFGACLRTADAAGVHAVIIPQDNAVGITPTVRKVACGAAETMPIIQVSNLARVMRDLQQQGVWIVGTCGEATDSLYDLDLKGGIALVMGAEEKGLRTLTRKHCDFLAQIPMLGSVSSLNVSVATGVCLFEIVRQR